MRRTPADERAPLVREALETQRASDDLGMRRNERERRRSAEKALMFTAIDLEATS